MKIVKFSEWLNLRESLSVYVKDHDRKHDLSDINQLGYYLHSKIIHPWLDKLPPEKQNEFNKERTKYGHYTITADGLTGDISSLNFYTSGIPENVVKNMLQGVDYFLKEARATRGPFKMETSRLFGSPVIRIPIIKMPSKENDQPPEINMANLNAERFFKALGYSRYYGDFNARELLMKMGSLDIKNSVIPHHDSGNDGKVRAFTGGLDEDHIKYYIGKIAEICKWAINHHYDTIYLA